MITTLTTMLLRSAAANTRVTVGLALALLPGAITLPAADTDPYKLKPSQHEQNRLAALQAHEANLRRLGADTNFFLRPGLIADKRRQRVELMAERSTVGKDSPCEFTVVAETSEHGYETLLIAFAKPSDVQQALQFLGTEPGASYDPASLRFWAKGETFILSVARSNSAPVRLEQLLVDRRTGKPLREAGFLFGGSRIEPALNDPRRMIYVADEYQPKSIVSLFNATDSVLEVPYFARKEDVYQNTTINPAHDLPAGTMVTLIIEAARKDGSRRVKDLTLHVLSGALARDAAAGRDGALDGLRVQLKDGDKLLNDKPTLLAAVETMAALDRQKHDYFLSVRFADDVVLTQAQAVAKVLAIIDSDKGVRIEPPAKGQIFYRSFTPDLKLLDRESRLNHPWELSLEKRDGRLSGRLLLVDLVTTGGGATAGLRSREVSVSDSSALRKQIDAERERISKAGHRHRPPVILVFTPADLTFGELFRFLEPSLDVCNIVHVYPGLPMPSPPAQKP